VLEAVLFQPRREPRERAPERREDERLGQRVLLAEVVQLLEEELKFGLHDDLVRGVRGPSADNGPHNGLRPGREAAVVGLVAGVVAGVGPVVASSDWEVIG
jgi:hypothetical protein